MNISDGACIVRSVRRFNIRTWIGDRRGAAAIEFAIVSIPFFLTLAMVACVALVLFTRQQLDYATAKAARQVMDGTVQTNGYSSSAFRTQAVCTYLPAIISCNDVIINLQTVTEAGNPGGYYALVKPGATGLIIPQIDNTSAQFSPGVQGSYEYLQIIYPITFLPHFVAAFLGRRSYNGVPAYLAVSTAAFRNEQY